MTYEKLNYYQKIGDVASQILDIKEKIRTKRMISVLGLPDWFTPKDLLEFQFERIRILEVATRCDEKKILEWLDNIEKRPNSTKREEFYSQSEKQLLMLGLIK